MRLQTVHQKTRRLQFSARCFPTNRLPACTPEQINMVLDKISEKMSCFGKPSKKITKLLVEHLPVHQERPQPFGQLGPSKSPGR